MPRNCRKVVLAACAAVAWIGSTIVHALAATQLEQAELAGRTPELQARVEARAVSSNSVTEVMLLNNIKDQKSQIVAMDWAKGVGVVQLPYGSFEGVNFEPRTLQIGVSGVGTPTHVAPTQAM